MLISGAHLIGLAALGLTGWQLRSHALSVAVWTALTLLAVCLLVFWRRSLAPKPFELRALQPAASRRWRAHLKGRDGEFDLEIVNWTRVGPLLALDIRSADPTFTSGRSLLRFLLARDQCTDAQWRQLLASLTWMANESN